MSVVVDFVDNTLGLGVLHDCEAGIFNLHAPSATTWLAHHLPDGVSDHSSVGEDGDLARWGKFVKKLVHSRLNTFHGLSAFQLASVRVGPPLSHQVSLTGGQTVPMVSLVDAKIDLP